MAGDAPGPGELAGRERELAELVGWRYAGPFDDLEPGSGVEHRVVGWDVVSMEEGTGIVHIAPAFGADDLALAQKNKIPLIHHVSDEGKFIETVRTRGFSPVGVLTVDVSAGQRYTW